MGFRRERLRCLPWHLRAPLLLLLLLLLGIARLFLGDLALP